VISQFVSDFVLTGMMDAAYFIGRKELLEFFNELLDLNLTKIEQTATGAIACQITDLIFPGSIPMSKVNWAARSDYEFVQNYKLLQSAFTKNCVQRHVDVDKLIRAKYQDNLEFCQWLKAFFDQSGRSRHDDYDPSTVRARGKGGVKYNETMSKPKIGGGTVSRSRPIDSVGPSATVATRAKVRSGNTKPLSNSSDRIGQPLRERDAGDVATLNTTNAVADAELLAKNQELLTKIDELELAVLDTERERNFYFEKLRNVEIILQVYQERDRAEANPDHMVDNVFKILYATAEDNLAVNEDGDVVPVDDLI
jgi:microtubule-associated protein, RP/EB family